jgi:hypothetical protein
MNPRKILILLGSAALIPGIVFACALLGAFISDSALVASVIPLAVAAIYVILKMLMLHINSTVLTLMHVGVWLVLFAGFIFEFYISLFLGVILTIGALSIGIVQALTLAGCGFVAFLVVFAATRKLWAANLVILSFCFLVFLICSIMISLPGAASH